MPYIAPRRRKWVNAAQKALTPGELTYLITKKLLEHDESTAYQQAEKIVYRYLDEQPQRYQHYAEVLGCLDSTVREWDRRVNSNLGVGELPNRKAAIVCRRVANKLYTERVAPYEDQKIEENGDVYE